LVWIEGGKNNIYKKSIPISKVGVKEQCVFENVVAVAVTF